MVHQNWNHYVPPDGLQELLPWKIFFFFRGFGRNMFNRMMNRFEIGGLLQSLEKFMALLGMRLVPLILVQSKFPPITKKF